MHIYLPSRSVCKYIDSRWVELSDFFLAYLELAAALMTPLLIFIGVPPPVAVGTEATGVASSVSGVLAHWRRANVDFKMGFVLLLVVL